MDKILHHQGWWLSHYLQGFKPIPGGCLGFCPSTVLNNADVLPASFWWRLSTWNPLESSHFFHTWLRGSHQKMEEGGGFFSDGKMEVFFPRCQKTDLFRTYMIPIYYILTMYRYSQVSMYSSKPFAWPITQYVCWCQTALYSFSLDLYSQLTDSRNVCHLCPTSLRCFLFLHFSI